MPASNTKAASPGARMTTPDPAPVGASDDRHARLAEHDDHEEPEPFGEERRVDRHPAKDRARSISATTRPGPGSILRGQVRLDLVENLGAGEAQDQQQVEADPVRPERELP